MMLNYAEQGYIYQDILGAYLIAKEIVEGQLSTSFSFDYKKAKEDKFDDLTIYRRSNKTYIQVKYSNDTVQHTLTKADFSNKNNYDLALHDFRVHDKKLFH